MTRADVIHMTDSSYAWLRDVELPNLRELSAWVDHTGRAWPELLPAVPAPKPPRVVRGRPIQTHCKRGHRLPRTGRRRCSACDRFRPKRARAAARV